MISRQDSGTTRNQSTTKNIKTRPNCTGIVTNSLAKVAISEIIQRDDQTLNIKINSTNKLLTKLGMKYNWPII